MLNIRFFLFRYLLRAFEKCSASTTWLLTIPRDHRPHIIDKSPTLCVLNLSGSFLCLILPTMGQLSSFNLGSICGCHRIHLGMRLTTDMSRYNIQLEIRVTKINKLHHDASCRTQLHDVISVEQCYFVFLHVRQGAINLNEGSKMLSGTAHHNNPV